MDEKKGCKLKSKKKKNQRNKTDKLTKRDGQDRLKYTRDNEKVKHRFTEKGQEKTKTGSRKVAKHKTQKGYNLQSKTKNQHFNKH